MQKDFLRWHTQKASLDSKLNRIFFHERDIWFTHLGAIPLTKTEKNMQAYYFSFSMKKNEKSSAILSQIRLIDSKRLKYKIGTINKSDFILLKTKIRQLVA